jgi:hypothetical protein
VSNPSFFEILKDGLLFRNPYKDKKEKDSNKEAKEDMQDPEEKKETDMDTMRNHKSPDRVLGEGSNFKLSKFKNKLSKLKLDHPKYESKQEPVQKKNFKADGKPKEKEKDEGVIRRPHYSNALTEKSFGKYLDKEDSGRKFNWKKFRVSGGTPKTTRRRPTPKRTNATSPTVWSS